MRRFDVFLLIIVSILLLQGNSSCQEKEIVPSSSAREEYVEGRLIVKFRSGAFNEKGELISQSVKKLNTKYGLISMEPVFKGSHAKELSYIYMLTFPKERDIRRIIPEYIEDASVVYAEPDYVVHITQ